MGSNGDQVEIGSQEEKRRPGRKKEARKKKGGQEEKWQKKGRKWVRALCAMILETAEQAKVIFRPLFLMKAKKVRFIKLAMVSHESRGLKGNFGRKRAENGFALIASFAYYYCVSKPSI